MPELPEVETVRRGLAPFLEGAMIADVRLNRPNLRFAFPLDFTARLTGATIKSVNRRAKYLLIELATGDIWLSHLGMTGNFALADHIITSPSRYFDTPPNGKHDHVQILLTRSDQSAATLVYSDPRRFGFMDIYKDPAACAYLRDLGPEPLGNEFSAAHLARRFAKRKQPIKSALLDQRNIAGLGNIYVCEALWRAHIAPQTPAHCLVGKNGKPTEKLEALSRAIRRVLEEAIAAGGSTLKDFRNSDGQGGYFQHNFDVYDREGQPCHTANCQGAVARIVQSGRSSFFCPTCQTETC